MADRQTHLDIAIGAGLVAGLLSVKTESLSAFLAEVGGVLAGSALGGVLPDILEPATSSWHRKSFHSVAALAGSSSLTVKPPIGVIGWRESLRNEATVYRYQRDALGLAGEAASCTQGPDASIQPLRFREAFVFDVFEEDRRSFEQVDAPEGLSLSLSPVPALGSDCVWTVGRGELDVQEVKGLRPMIR